MDETTGEMRKVAIESGSSVEWTEEENYKFRLGAFKERLIDWLENTETRTFMSFVGFPST